MGYGDEKRKEERWEMGRRVKLRRERKGIEDGYGEKEI